MANLLNFKLLIIIGSFDCSFNNDNNNNNNNNKKAIWHFKILVMTMRWWTRRKLYKNKKLDLSNWFLAAFSFSSIQIKKFDSFGYFMSFFINKSKHFSVIDENERLYENFAIPSVFQPAVQKRCSK